MILIAVPIALIAGVFTVAIVRSERDGAKLESVKLALLARGTPATGKVLAMELSRRRVTHSGRLLRLTIQVTHARRQGYRDSELHEMQIEQAIPLLALSGIFPGAEVKLRIDPSDPASAIVDLLAMGYR